MKRSLYFESLQNVIHRTMYTIEMYLKKKKRKTKRAVQRAVLYHGLMVLGVVSSSQIYREGRDRKKERFPPTVEQL